MRRAAGRRPRPRRSATCASRSPTAATSAASTACPPRACRGWTATRCSPTRRSRALVALLASMGVHDVRLTGGEPLVRRELWRLVEMLVGDRGRPRPLADHQRLPARRARSTTSCAPACGASTSRSTRSRPTASSSSPAATRSQQVLDGLAAAAAPPRAAPDQGQRRRAARTSPRTRCVRFAEFARQQPVRGPLHRVHAARRRPRVERATSVLPNAEVRRADRRRVPARGRSAASATAPRGAGASPTARARSASSPPSREPFCGDCNRIRLTAEGKLRTCLFSMTRDRPARAAARRRERRRARADHPRRRLAQGAQAPRQRRRASCSRARTMSQIGG